MGFLEAGTPLPWTQALEFAAYVREHGIKQFLFTFHRVKGRTNDLLKWGDEIEYHLVEFRPETKEVRVSLTAPEVVAELEKQDKELPFNVLSAWRPEYGSWMVEATPGAPYGGSTSDLLQVELNMAVRRFRIQAVCGTAVVPFSIVGFPLLGVGSFTSPARSPGGPFAHSCYIPDSCISPHPRFGTLTANIRRRRGRKVCIQMPLYKDQKTDMRAVTLLTEEGKRLEAGAAAAAGAPAAAGKQQQQQHPNDAPGRETQATHFFDAYTAHLQEQKEKELAEKEKAGGSSAADTPVDEDADTVGAACVARDGFIHMDAMAFGMGCCCLQVTFQARDLSESRYLYDQLAVLSPIMMALTANTAVWRGRLADTDTRWHTIAASVDCRTPAESGSAERTSTAASTAASGACSASASDSAAPALENPSWMSSAQAVNAAGQGKRLIQKSRYSSVDCYINGDKALLKDSYNDVPLPMDEKAYGQLVEGGVDERLARHIASLFVRDPLVIFKERVFLDDEKSTEHFENIQSTNWRSVRWKPPPPDAPGMGWRVELRTMEAQVTDFENAAFTVFVVLLSRVLIAFNLNLYVPLSKVDENMERAKERDAVLHQKFYFRKRITPACSTSAGELEAAAGAVEAAAERSSSSNSSGAAATASSAASGAVASPSSSYTSPLRSMKGSASSGNLAMLEGLCSPIPPGKEDEYEEMTLSEIMLGKIFLPAASGATTDSAGASAGAAGSSSSSSSSSAFPGLIPLIYAYLDGIHCDDETRKALSPYLRLVAQRSQGKVMTGAAWQREFIRKHPAYEKDSVVSQQICYDLLEHMHAVVKGRKAAPELLGEKAPSRIRVREEDLGVPFSSIANVLPVMGAHAQAQAEAAAAAASSAAGAAAAGASAAGLPPLSPAKAAGAGLSISTAPSPASSKASGAGAGFAGVTGIATPIGAKHSSGAATPGSNAGGVRLRAGSFAEEMRASYSCCSVVQSLLEQHAGKHLDGDEADMMQLLLAAGLKEKAAELEAAEKKQEGQESTSASAAAAAGSATAAFQQICSSE